MNDPTDVPDPDDLSTLIGELESSDPAQAPELADHIADVLTSTLDESATTTANDPGPSS